MIPVALLQCPGPPVSLSPGVAALSKLWAKIRRHETQSNSSMTQANSHAAVHSNPPNDLLKVKNLVNPTQDLLNTEQLQYAMLMGTLGAGKKTETC